MTGSGVIDLTRLRRSCARCSLRTLCLPASLAPGDIDRLDRLVQSRGPLERREFLFHAGAEFEALYVVRTGSLRTSCTTEEGDIQVLGFHLPGELVGLEGLGTDVHQCDAVALERTTLCAMPFRDLQRVAAEIPGLQRQMYRLIGRDTVGDQDHLVEIGRRSARERVALFLHNLSTRYSGAGYDRTRLQLSMSREDIANYLGLAHETVSRLLRTLSDEGTIEVKGRSLEIQEPGRLAASAGVAEGGRS